MEDALSCSRQIEIETERTARMRGDVRVRGSERESGERVKCRYLLQRSHPDSSGCRFQHLTAFDTGEWLGITWQQKQLTANAELLSLREQTVAHGMAAPCSQLSMLLTTLDEIDTQMNQGAASAGAGIDILPFLRSLSSCLSHTHYHSYLLL